MSAELERVFGLLGNSYAIAKRLGVSDSTVRTWRLRGKVPPKYEATLRAITEGKPAVPLDPLPPGHRLKGVSSLVQPDGTVSAQWVKTTAEDDRDELLRRLLRELPSEVPTRAAIAAPVAPSSSDLLAVYPLGDPHVGMLAWAREGGADFDLEICERLMVGAMRDLVLRGPRTERALIVNLGDFFHYDNASAHTTRGDHALDTDGRAPKVLAVGLRIMTTLIDAALEHHDAVSVDCRIGNHDAHTALMLSLALAAYYRNTPRVAIPPTVKHREYHEFGQVLIGTTHGDRAKPVDLPAIMAAEQAEAWGRTKHRTWLVGHVHHHTVREHRGCKVETFRTLAASDSWHAAQGYVSGRDMHRIVFHRERGEVSREIVNVGALLRTARGDEVTQRLGPGR